jgi:hypothetical protein
MCEVSSENLFRFYLVSVPDVEHPHPHYIVGLHLSPSPMGGVPQHHSPCYTAGDAPVPVYRTLMVLPLRRANKTCPLEVGRLIQWPSVIVELFNSSLQLRRLGTASPSLARSPTTSKFWSSLIQRHVTVSSITFHFLFYFHSSAGMNNIKVPQFSSCILSIAFPTLKSSVAWKYCTRKNNWFKNLKPTSLFYYASAKYLNYLFFSIFHDIKHTL